jgi:hypothetical protein
MASCSLASSASPCSKLIGSCSDTASEPIISGTSNSYFPVQEDSNLLQV